MKYRVIVNDVSFYTTARQIQLGVGSNTGINIAVQEAKKGLKRGTTGYVTSVRIYDSKMNPTEYMVQIDRL